jgi:type II secretion system protein G
MRRRRQSGFTLIELMVVVAIIGVLSSIGMVNVRQALEKSANSVRKETLSALRTAIYNYYLDNGRFPSGGPGATVVSGIEIYAKGSGGGYPNVEEWIPGLGSKYLKNLPKDPQGGAGVPSTCVGWNKSYMYLVTQDGQQFKLLSHCASPEGDYKPTDTLYDPVRPTWAWQVSNAPCMDRSFSPDGLANCP